MGKPQNHFLVYLISSSKTYGEQGWCSGESTRLPPMWPGFDSQTLHHNNCGLGLLLVFVLRGFSPGTPVSPSPQKPTFPNSNLIQNLRATGLSIVTDC